MIDTAKPAADIALLNGIRNHILNREKQDALGALQGSASEALFLFYTSRVLHDSSFAEAGEEIIGRAFDALNEPNNNKINLSYYDGVAGFCWVMHHLSREEFIDFDTADLAGLESLLRNARQHLFENKMTDLFFGLIGNAMYLTEKNHLTDQDKAELHDSVVKLLSLSKKTDRGITWPETDYVGGYAKHIEANFGLAHGLPATLIFLCKCFEAGVCTGIIPAAVEETIRYMLSYKRDSSNPSVFSFPSEVVEETGEHNSRMGWCYGDQGIALMLWRCGKTFGRNQWKEMAVELMKTCATRFGYDQTLLVDANLCHGTTGVSVMFKRFYQETGIELFRERSLFWANETYQYLALEDGIARFSYKEFMQFDFSRTSLLEGSSGCGLGLLTAVSAEAPDWDRVMLIS